MLAGVVRAVERLYCWSNRSPQLEIRRLLWVLTLGWALALLYVLYAAAMLLSILFAPFAWQALRLALLALDGGITLEPSSQYLSLSLEVSCTSTGRASRRTAAKFAPTAASTEP